MTEPRLPEMIAFVGEILKASIPLQNGLEVEIMAQRLEHEAFVSIVRGLSDGNDRLYQILQFLSELAKHEDVVLSALRHPQFRGLVAH